MDLTDKIYYDRTESLLHSKKKKKKTGEEKAC